MPPDIAFIADDAYTPPLHAALVSLFDSGRRAPARPHRDELRALAGDPGALTFL